MDLKQCKRQYNGEARGECAIPKMEPRGEHDTASGRRPTSFSSVQSTAALKGTLVSSMGLILGRHKSDPLGSAYLANHLSLSRECRLAYCTYDNSSTIQVQFKYTE